MYGAIDQRKQRVITANADVFVGVMLGAALTNDDVTGNGRLTTEQFHTQAFAHRVAAVP